MVMGGERYWTLGYISYHPENHGHKTVWDFMYDEWKPLRVIWEKFDRLPNREGGPLWTVRWVV